MPALSKLYIYRIIYFTKLAMFRFFFNISNKIYFRKYFEIYIFGIYILLYTYCLAFIVNILPNFEREYPHQFVYKHNKNDCSVVLWWSKLGWIGKTNKIFDALRTRNWSLCAEKFAWLMLFINQQINLIKERTYHNGEYNAD